MASFFERLYKNKQSENGRNQKENFLTEILAHCLEHDLDFRKKMFKHIGVVGNCENFICKPQFSHSQFGRPDLFIKLDNHTILIIECKIDSIQGETQLSRYANILREDEAVSKHLVFLTKFYEKVEILENDVNFKHIRWHEVFDLLNNSQQEISKELTYYLIEQKMNLKVIPFTISDINAISYINDTIAKMDDFLAQLEDILMSYSLNKIRWDKVNDLTSWAQYGIITEFIKGSLWLGFYQYDDEMQIGLDFSFPSNSLIGKEFEKVLEIEDWKSYSDDTETIGWYKAIPLSVFIEENIFQSKIAFDVIEKEVHKIKSIGLLS